MISNLRKWQIKWECDIKENEMELLQHLSLLLEVILEGEFRISNEWDF